MFRSHKRLMACGSGRRDFLPGLLALLAVSPCGAPESPIAHTARGWGVAANPLGPRCGQGSASLGERLPGKAARMVGCAVQLRGGGGRDLFAVSDDEMCLSSEAFGRRAEEQAIADGYNDSRAEVEAYVAVRQLGRRCRQEDRRVRCISDGLSPQTRAALGRAVAWAPTRGCPVHDAGGGQRAGSRGAVYEVPAGTATKVYIDGIHELVGMLENRTLHRLQLGCEVEKEVAASLRAYSRGRSLPVHPASRFSQAIADVESELAMCSAEVAKLQRLERKVGRGGNTTQALETWRFRVRLAEAVLMDMTARRSGRANWTLADIDERGAVAFPDHYHYLMGYNFTKQGASWRKRKVKSPPVGDPCAKLGALADEGEDGGKNTAGGPQLRVANKTRPAKALPAGVRQVLASDERGTGDDRRGKGTRDAQAGGVFSGEGGSAEDVRMVEVAVHGVEVGKATAVGEARERQAVDLEPEVPEEPDDRDRLVMMRERDRWERQERRGVEAAGRKRPGDAVHRDLRRRRLQAAGFS